MAEPQPPPQSAAGNVQPQAVIDSVPAEEDQRLTDEQTSEILKEIQENAGQISELTTEEEGLVKDFFDCLLKMLKPFGKTLEISTGSLPGNYSGRTSKAYLYLTGQLVLVFINGEVEILNLADRENHGILVEIIGEIMLKLKSVINICKTKAEKRVKLLMSITGELQKVADVFSEDNSKI